MQRYLCQLLMLMLTIIVLPTFAAAKPPKKRVEPIIVYTQAQPNIALSSKQPVFSIQLKANPSTGFSWFLRDYDHSVLTPLKHATEASDTGMMGAPGYETFTFKVNTAAFVVPQVTALRFYYMRPSQGVENSTQVVFHVAWIS